MTSGTKISYGTVNTHLLCENEKNKGNKGEQKNDFNTYTREGKSNFYENFFEVNAKERKEHTQKIIIFSFGQ